MPFWFPGILLAVFGLTILIQKLIRQNKFYYVPRNCSWGHSTIFTGLFMPLDLGYQWLNLTIIRRMVLLIFQFWCCICLVLTIGFSSCPKQRNVSTSASQIFKFNIFLLGCSYLMVLHFSNFDFSGLLLRSGCFVGWHCIQCLNLRLVSHLLLHILPRLRSHCYST